MQEFRITQGQYGCDPLLKRHAHRVRRWLIIEKNAAATVDLQVDEPGRKHRPERHDLGGPVT
jgi:hypothetical protein